MSTIVISVENLSKTYRLGQIGTGTLTYDLKVWWAKKHGRSNPLLKIGQEDHGNRDGETIWALKDINFQVRQGEVLGIIGRNGAGKSTLLKILAQVTAPTEGVVRYKGRIASLLEVGTGFHPDLTGRENIYLNGAILGMKREEVRRKFDEIVAFSEVEKFIDTPIKRYSSGMYVRLAFAVAAHLEPEILLVDEVLAVGDAGFQNKCLGKISGMAKGGRTVLFVSHNMAAIERICKTGMIIQEGRIMATGSTKDIIGFYIDQLNIISATNSPEVNPDNSPVNIKNIELLNNDTEKTEIIQTGDHILLRFITEFRDHHSGLYIGAGLLDQWGKLVFAFHSREAGILIDNLVTNSLITEIDIPKLLLLPGKYYFRISISDNLGLLKFELPNAITFTVLPKDFSGLGHYYSDKHGLILIPFKLRFHAGNQEWTKSIPDS